MAKKINLPAIRARHDIVDDNDDEFPLDSIYPTEYVLPKPSRFAFRNERMARRIESYVGVVDQANKLFDALSTNQRALARLHNVSREIAFDREVLELNLARVRKKRRDLHAHSSSPPHTPPSAVPPDYIRFGKKVDDE
jgi:hypothetical protein